MEEEQRGTARRLEAGFEHVHPDPVDVVDETRTNARWKHRGTVRRGFALVA